MTATIRRSNKLTDTAIRNAKPKPKPYKLTDADGLFLLVQPNGSKLWRYRFWLHEKEGMMALGRYDEVSLADARDRLAQARKLVANGINPVDAQKRAKLEAIQEQQRNALGTFGAVCQAWRDLTDKTLRPATVKQRSRELDNDLLPALSSRQVASMTRIELTELLRSVERRAPETARNLRTHLYAIFEHAIDAGLLQSNPTPPRRIMQPRRQESHAAMPVHRIGDFLRALDSANEINPATRVAMLLVILSACRKEEAIGARWSEFDLEAGLWTIPGARMKAGREHLVPLPRQAISMLRELHDSTTTKREHLFPNRRDPGRPMANRSLNALLDRLGFGSEATIHGFRSVFSTRYNALEMNPDVIEACLAHVHANSVRRVYNRASYLEQRRELLQDWADWIDQQRDGAIAA